MTSYTPPPVWTWEAPSGGAFASINRPTAGAQFDFTLPQGDKGLQIYSLGTLNGLKVTILLEELLAIGLPAEYDLFKIDIRKGDQFGSGFVEINPNSKIPAMLDTSTAPLKKSLSLVLFCSTLLRSLRLFYRLI